MAQTETRRGYTIEVLSEDDPFDVFSMAAPSSGVEEIVSAARDETGEVLMIDGKPVPFTKSADGYNIYYIPTQETLIEAARIFVDTQPEKPQ